MSELPPIEPQPITPPPVIPISGYPRDEEPVRARSRIWPFVVLGLSFALVFALAVSGLRRSERKEESVSQLEQTLKFSFAGKVIAGLSPTQDPVAQGNADKSLRESLEKVVAEADDFPKSLEAAKVQLEAEFELKRKPSSTALKLLQTSAKEEDRNLARIYEADKMSKEQAQMWSPKGDSFSDKLARAHAYQKAGDTSVREELISVREFGPVLGLSAFGLAALALGFVLLLGMTVMARRPNWPVAPPPMPSVDEGDRHALRGAVALFAYIAAGLAVAIGMGAGLPEVAASVFMQPIWIGMIVFFLQVPAFGVSDSWLKLFNGSQPGWKSLFGLSGYFADLPLVLAAFVLSMQIAPYLPAPTHPISKDMASGDPATIAATFFMAAIMAPIVEETIFRGFIQRAFMGLMGRPWPAIVLQAFMFAAIHPQGPAGWLPLMTIGGMCGWLTYRSGSLLPAMVLHCVHNAVLVLSLTILL